MVGNFMRLIKRASMEGLAMPVTETKNRAPICERSRPARAMARLTHENIVALYDIGEHRGIPYMVLEYVQGKTLSAWLTERAEREGEQKDGDAFATPTIVLINTMKVVV